ncbi:alpha/beta hydrolase [Nocardiopsis tropica]|uniref:alpha/beta hydrolase n=1 Tax=Tsukamurella strandjordii TaxID=147577 RepID=UPI0031D811D9
MNDPEGPELRLGANDRQLRAASRVPVRHVVDRRTYRAVRGAIRMLGLVPSPGVERRALSRGATVRIFRPSGSPGERRPGVLWIHGGGYVVGTARQDDHICRRICRATGSVVVSVDYRLAPEHPYPAAVEDCRAGLELLASLPGVDESAITVSGASAGGGLAAQLVHEQVRRGGRVPVRQVLFYPMLDPSVRSAQQEPAGVRVWDARSNRFGWDSYLRGSAEFVPVLDSVSSRIPPTWIGVGTTDLFHREAILYAESLRAEGVEVELVTVEHGFHGFDVAAPWTASAKAFTRSALAAMRRGDRS